MKRAIIADLHNHTTASDGEFSPEEIVTRAKTMGLEVIGITDHDSLEGLDRALAEGEKQQVKVVPGVEVSLCFIRPYFKGSLHLLLYFNSALLADDRFRKMLCGIMEKGRGDGLVRTRVDAINREFGPGGRTPLLERALTFDEIKAHGKNISRRHFALTLQNNHHLEDPQVVQRIIGNNSPAYVPSGIDMKLLEPVINAFPLVSVFAHPAAGEFPGPSHYKEVLPNLDVIRKVYPEFLALGLDGLEVYYPGHTEPHRGMMKEWAEKDGLIITGGSDCHDEVKRPLGVEGLTREEYDAFSRRLAANEVMPGA